MSIFFVLLVVFNTLILWLFIIDLFSAIKLVNLNTFGTSFHRVYQRNLGGTKIVQLKDLPPTVNAVRPHLKRAYYQVRKVSGKSMNSCK